MKSDNNKTADAVRIVCSAVLAAVFFLTLFVSHPARAASSDPVPGAGIGAFDGDRDGDGVIEGPQEEAASDIGDSIGRGIEEIKEGAESLAKELIGGEKKEESGRGAAETDPGVVKDNSTDEETIKQKTGAGNEPAATFWSVAAVVGSAALVIAIAVAISKRDPKKEDK